MAREKVLCGKEEIIRAAVRIVDSEGMEALSARRISKELGVSAMTIYNYVENLAEVKKYVLSDGFDRLYDSISHALNELRGQVDKVKFCKTIAMQVFQFASENRNIFIFMFFEGRSQFREDAEIRPFYNFIAKLTKRSKATQKDWAENAKAYVLLESYVIYEAYQACAGLSEVTKEQFSSMIDFLLEKCVTKERQST